LFPTPKGEENIASITPSSTSFLNVLDVPISASSLQMWAIQTHMDFSKSLETSLVGCEVLKHIKHVPCVMRNLKHSDSAQCVVDIHDTLSRVNWASLIGKFIPCGTVNCHIAGAKPRSGSLLCTHCQKWGHHANQCRSKSVHCSLCGGPHSEANHVTFVKVNPK
jgi:hypothetical protein